MSVDYAKWITFRALLKLHLTTPMKARPWHLRSLRAQLNVSPRTTVRTMLPLVEAKIYQLEKEAGFHDNES